jgi:uncharacterized repeat protein (TIGR01451 family)
VVRYIFFLAITPLMAVGIFIAGEQVKIQGSYVEVTPVNWPSSSPKYMQTTAPASADLSLSKSGSPDPVLVGSMLTYTITITNGGPSAAVGVLLVDFLPAPINFGSATPSQGNCDQTGFIITCDLNNLNHLAMATVTIVVTPTQATTIFNTAAIAADTPFDSNLANNLTTIATLVQSASPSPFFRYLPIIFK